MKVSFFLKIQLDDKNSKKTCTHLIGVTNFFVSEIQIHKLNALTIREK